MEWKEKRKDNVGMDKGNQEYNNIGGSQENVRCCSRKETENQGGIKMSLIRAVVQAGGWTLWSAEMKRSMKEFPTRPGELNDGYTILNVGDLVYMTFNDGIHIVVVSKIKDGSVSLKTIKKLFY